MGLGSFFKKLFGKGDETVTASPAPVDGQTPVATPPASSAPEPAAPLPAQPAA